jgi:regulator of sigma E protease
VSDSLAGIGSFGAMGLFFLLAIAIIVAIHEYGHYIVGRWCGIHAEVFSLGFGPVLASRRDKRGTKWQLAAIPFGGYVKFMGDADAASVRSGALEGLSAAERRRTMAGAPLWARTLTVLAGPVANFLLGFLILASFYMLSGVPANPPVIAEIRAVAQGPGDLRAGDRVLALNGTETPTVEAFRDAYLALPAEPEVRWTIERDGQTIAITGPHPNAPLVREVHPKSAAGDAGLEEGDNILAANGQPVAAFEELPDIVKAANGAPVTLSVWRNGQTFEVTMTPRWRDLPKVGGGFEKRLLLGLTSAPLVEFETVTPGLVETVTTAAGQTWALITNSLSGLWHIVTGMISACNLSGPIGMAEVMGEAGLQGADVFIQRLAILSIGIGLLNLLPIPVLDGGHLVFYAYEAVARRPPADRALRFLMTVGLTLLLSVMAFALTNDIRCV